MTCRSAGESAATSSERRAPLKRIAFACAFVAAVVASGGAVAQSPQSHPGDRIFQLTALHEIHLTISAAEWAALQTSSPRGGGATGGSDYKAADGRLIHVGSGFGGYFPWARATLRVGNTEIKDAGIRYKGNFTFTSSSASAPLFANFKVKIDVYGADGSWDGVRTFNIHPGVIDRSKMRDAVAFALFRGAGVPAPRTTYAEVFFTVPGIYSKVSGGLYTVIEDVNRRSLQRTLPPGTGLLMKPEGMRGGVQSLGASWSNYVNTFRPDRDATPHEQRRVMEFAGLVSQSDVGLFRREIGKYLDVDRFLRFLAINAFIVNTDSYLGGGHNFYIYLDPADDKFRFIPWDQDLSMNARGTGNAGVDLITPYRGDQPLIYWLLDDPAVMAQYRAIWKELSSTVLSVASVTTLVDDIEKVGTGRGPSPRAFLQSRAEYLQQVVAGWK